MQGRKDAHHAVGVCVTDCVTVLLCFARPGSARARNYGVLAKNNIWFTRLLSSFIDHWEERRKKKEAAVVIHHAFLTITTTTIAYHHHHGN